ncbi:MAG: DUF4232 domain-containing protein [Solirubrobacteraceae bacterium]
MKRLVLLPIVVLLAACGSSAGGSAASTTTDAAATATATAPPTTSATSATAPATTTTTTTTTAANPPPCRAANLSLSFLGQQGGMGHGEIGFELRNTSADSCRTYGYPGILFLDRSGGALPTIPHHTTNDFFGSTPAVPLVIAPGQSASFRLDVGHGVATANGCATAYGLQVIPPNDTATLRTTIPNGSYECRDANVSPLRAGASAYP